MRRERRLIGSGEKNFHGAPKSKKEKKYDLRYCSTEKEHGSKEEEEEEEDLTRKERFTQLPVAQSILCVLITKLQATEYKKLNTTITP